MIPASNPYDDQLDKVTRFWQEMQKASIAGEQKEEFWKEKTAFLDNFSIQNNVVVLLWNVARQRFVYMSEKCEALTGIKASAYLEADMSIITPGYHPNQVEGLVALHKKYGGFFMKNVAKLGPQGLIVNFNYLYRNADNKYIQLLQRSSVLEVDELNIPSLIICFLYYAGYMKRPESLGAVFGAGDELSFYTYNSQLKAVEGPAYFSKQEKKIISLLADGYSSKEIADHMSISVNTVNTHRRNIINKAECLDTTGVIAYARLINLI
jgi:DNA-binding CsgD family transcriptional regulator